MMKLNYILSIYTLSYKFAKVQRKINYFVYMDGINLFERKIKKEAEILIQAIRIYSQNNGIWHRKMCPAHNEKWKKKNYERERIAKSKKKVSERTE